jgi:PAS domain S-box-containing protein
MKIFGSISFKIWIYFSSILFISSAIVIYYFPNQQKQSILKYRGNELTELSRTIALGVELSLDVNDFQKLNKSLGYYRNKKSEFDFLVVTQKKSDAEKEEIFSQISDNLKFNFYAIDTSNYLIRSAVFSTQIMDGKVIIGLSKNRVNKEVQKTNLPIYFVLVCIFLITIILFYVVARSVSSPINTVIYNAKLLQEEKYELFNIEQKKSTDEISQLQNALINLKDSLLLQKLENKNLLEHLEDKITERTENLNLTLVKLKEAQDIAELGYYSFNKNLHTFTFSENLEEKLLIKTSEEKKFEHLKSLIDKEYIDEFETNFTKQTTESFSIEVKTVLPDTVTGTFKWFAINGKYYKDKQTETHYLSGTIQEITMRKNAEAELRKLSQAVKNSHNSIIITDLNQKIVWINDSVLRLTGYSREEIIGNSPKMFQSSETNLETKITIRENLIARKSFKTEILNVTKNGNKYWLELYIQPIFSERGVAEGYMAVEIDITERKEKDKLILQYISEIESKQNEIVTANESLEIKVAEKTRDLEFSILQIQKSQEEIVKKEKMATLGVLIAGIAHEVNTPLGAIKASVDNLEHLFSLEFVKAINTISLDDLKQVLALYTKLHVLSTPSTIVQRQNAKNLLSIISENHPEIENAFVLSKELSSIGFESMNVDLIALLETSNYANIIKTVKLLLNIQRSLKTINEGAVKSGKIIRALNVYSHGTDQEQQTQFNLKENIDNIITLLSNKIKYHATVKNNIPENILLKGFEDELSQVWTNIINNALQASNNKCNIVIDYKNENNLHFISICNDGPKIPDIIIDKIFDEFFTTKKRGEGTGLGLNIVKSIVEKHHGKINCVSNEKNTIFTINLPVT